MQDEPQEPTQENIMDKFHPRGSGVLDRFLTRGNIDPGQASSVDQALGVSNAQEGENANSYTYLRTVEFPQPSIAGIGSVTSAGAKDTSRYFFSQKWTVGKNATGDYTITHKIGDNKYNVFLTPIATASFTAQVSVFATNSFNVKTFNAAGAAADCAFTFAVFIIP